MAITAPDIKLLESERMADTTDGGGRKTSRVIPDGVAGNIFPKVSRLDSVYGRVNLRKVFGAVQTADVDTYAGAHAIITDAPDNDKIHTTIFSTASEFDTRTAARDRVESFVTVGPESRMVLLGRQLPGQQSVSAYQRLEEPLPEIGEVIALSEEAGGVVTAQQYCRIQAVDSEIRTFTELMSGGYAEFKRRVLSIGVGTPLRYEFNGPENASQSSLITRDAKIRTTTVVDAARYYGIKKLAEPITAGDLNMKVQSVYTSIVPTTNREAPLSNQTIGSALNIVAARASARTETVPAYVAVSGKMYTLRPITPGSLTISGSGITTLSDNRKGAISNSTFSATVDYETGMITRTGGSANPSSYTLTYTPGGVATQTAHAIDNQITLGNRGSVYAFTLNPLPAPGGVTVDFLALGKWYRLRDDGAGNISGSDPAYGVGTLDYSTGAMVMTLGALPDVGSSVIVNWGSPAHYAIHAGATNAASDMLKQTLQLTELPITENSVSISYVSGGNIYTATDDANGVLTGGGITGSVNYTTGLVEFGYATRLPDSASTVAASYSKTTADSTVEDTLRGSTQAAGSSVALGGAVKPGSLFCNIQFAAAVGLSGWLLVRDNGAGLVFAAGSQKIAGNNVAAKDGVVSADTAIGSINYATGLITITNGVPVETVRWYGSFGGPAPLLAKYWWPETHTVTVTGATGTFGWVDSTVVSHTEAHTANFTFATTPIVADLLQSTSSRIVPGSAIFSAGGKTYIDRSGILYTDVSNTTGAGVQAGTMDYVNGIATITHWTDGAALNLSVDTALTTIGEYTTDDLYLRTAGSNLRPGSLYVQVTSEDGEQITATGDSSGVVTGTKVSGSVDHDTGIVRLRFGSMVTAAGNETEPWYSAGAVVGGMIFKPVAVIPSTFKYNAVVLTSLPINADILGIDPVRLPVDGRVPIYRPADVVVIHNTADFALPNPAVASAIYSVGRTNLSELWLVDSVGVKVDPAKYTYSLDTGTVTMASGLTLAGLVQPLIARHRIEDMAMLSDVQINGQLSVSAQITRDYGVDSFVSSALLFGDMNARVENVHDLLAFSTWTNVAGTQSNAQFNDIDYPVEVLNNGALTERWRINFTSATAFQVIGENLGVIATGSTLADISPANALTGNPYFVIRAAGWGAGWSAGNQLRFNTVGAAAPIWIARTVLPGATLDGDAFSMQMRGDVDA